MPALVPGMVDAGLLALREFGTKSFGEIAAPAIELADGMAIDEMRSGSIARSQPFFDLLAGFEEAFSAERAGADAGGDLPPAGSGADAAVDGRGGEGGAGQGRGPQSRRSTRCGTTSTGARSRRKIGEFSKNNGGLLRYEDMAAFKLQLEEPVSTEYRGYTVYKPGFWSQGPAMLEALNILEGYDMKAMPLNSAEYIHRWWRR